jgi:omega-amidase
MVRQAADAGARLVCFPEQFATGWSPRSARFAENLDGLVVSRLQEYAKRYAIALLGSFVEHHLPMPRNTCVAIDSTGEILATYAKIHLFTPGGEHQYYSPGEDLAHFSIDSVKFGIAICYDLRFSELFSLYRELGVHCVLVPAAWPCSRIAHWELLIRARALENQYYMAGITCTGTTPVDRYCGGSLTADPIGAIAAHAGEGGKLLVSVLDTDLIGQVRTRLPVNNDRRPDLYDRLTREGGGQ